MIVVNPKAHQAAVEQKRRCEWALAEAKSGNLSDEVIQVLIWAADIGLANINQYFKLWESEMGGGQMTSI
jgi:hypothetical protein